MTRKRLLALVAAGAFGSALAYYVLVLPLFNPLRRSKSEITAYLLQQTPIGTPREEVRALIMQRGWRKGGIIGRAKAGDFGVVLGGYQGIPYRIKVFAVWQFDEHGRLEAVLIDKGADALVDGLYDSSGRLRGSVGKSLLPSSQISFPANESASRRKINGQK